MYADNLKLQLLGSLLVGQEPARSKCVLVSTSRTVRNDVRGWIFPHEGDKWSVKLDVRDLGGHLDTTFRVGRLLWLRGFGWSVLIFCSCS